MVKYEHPAASEFNGVKLDENGKLIPSAYNLVETFEWGKTPEREIFVSALGDGNDDNEGLYDAPVASLIRAVELAKSTIGVIPTAIRIFPGIYKEGTYLNKAYASENAPLWIGGIPGMDSPVFDGAGFGLSSFSYIILHDMEIRNIVGTTGTGINAFCTTPAVEGAEWAHDANYIIYRNLYMHHISYQDIKIAGVDHFWIFDCDISRSTQGGSGHIDGVGVHNGIIAYNYIHDSTNNQLAIQLKGGSSNDNIYGNLFRHASSGINVGQSTGVQFFRPGLVRDGLTTYEAKNLRIYSNVFIGGRHPFNFQGAKDSYAVNNTIILPEAHLFRILQGDENNDLGNNGMSHDNTIENNIFYYDFDHADFANNHREPFNVTANKDIETNIIKNNIIFNIKDAGNLPPKDKWSWGSTQGVPDVVLGENILISPLFISDADIINAADVNLPTYNNLTALDARRLMTAKICYKNLVLSENSPAVSGGTDFDFASKDFYGKSFAKSRSLGAMQF